MSEDLYAMPDLTKKVRFQTGEKEDGNADVGDTDNVTIYDNCWVEGSTPPKSQDNTTDVQQQTSSVNVSSGKKSLHRAVVVCLVLLCLVLLAVIIVLAALLIRLWVDNAKLTSERDEMESMSSQLEAEKNLLKEINTNLTNERDELQKEIETTRCPDDWIKFGNSCYVFFTTKKNWEESKNTCEKLDAQLVIISSQTEQEFINLFVQDVWIGLYYERAGFWRWVNGTRLTTEYWGHGQPDSRGPYNRRENCAEIGYRSQLKNWNDLHCYYVRNFICEKILQ